jgi:hypothetical protein
MVAEPAADDQDTLVAQWRQRPADREVGRRVVPPLHGELQDGHVRVWIGDVKRGEHAVVEASLGVDAGGNAGGVEELDHASSDRRRGTVCGT